MTTFDQKLAAQTGQVVVFANNAALALSRQVAERQRQLAQELRAPVIVETPAERAEKKEQPGDAASAKSFLWWSGTRRETQAPTEMGQTDTASMSGYEPGMTLPLPVSRRTKTPRVPFVTPLSVGLRCWAISITQTRSPYWDSTAKIASISTIMPKGSDSMPTAERA